MIFKGNVIQLPIEWDTQFMKLYNMHEPHFYGIAS
jgi:hypothetical protein